MHWRLPTQLQDREGFYAGTEALILGTDSAPGYSNLKLLSMDILAKAREDKAMYIRSRIMYAWPQNPATTPTPYPYTESKDLYCMSAACQEIAQGRLRN